MPHGVTTAMLLLLNKQCLFHIPYSAACRRPRLDFSICSRA